MFYQQENGCVVAPTGREWERWHDQFKCPNNHGQMEYIEITTGDDIYGQPEFVCYHECQTCGQMARTPEELQHT